MAIEDMLDTGLPRTYTPSVYQEKCSALFEHFYEADPDHDVNVYAAAG